MPIDQTRDLRGSTASSSSPFMPARITAAYLKMGIMGKQGAGKSKTAAKVGIGLVRYLKKLGVDYASKPVAMFDTEGGSDFLIPDFEGVGIPFVVAKKSGFADLLEATRWAEKNASVLIIDSITHPYRELIASYLRKKQRTFLQIDDWNYIKGEHGWEQFTKLYLNSNLHIIMCGRAGDDLEQYTDENGKRQIEKVGVKMKTEAETGFEPSLLVLMERNMNTRTNEVRHTATVLKDRWAIIDGKEIDNPDFSSFLPHIEKLNLGGEHVGIGSSDSAPALKTEKRDWQPVQREIVLDEIQTILELHAGGQSAEAKKNRLKLLLKHFDATWTEMEKVMPLPDLRRGYDSLHRELEGKPSRYAAEVGGATEQKPQIDDEIPLSGGGTDVDQRSLIEKLLADLAEQKTPADLLHWGLQVSTQHAVGLNEADRAKLNTAILARQNEIAKLPKPDGEEPDGEKQPEKPNKAKAKATPQPELQAAE